LPYSSQTGFSMAACGFCVSNLEALLVEELVEDRYGLEADGYDYGNFRSEVLKTVTTNEGNAKLLLKQ
jgi:hypothetical protein